MTDIKQYLKETNTVLLTKESFEYLKERASVLDKIRAEIEQDAFKDVNGSKYIFVNRINQIIDKYKAGVEPQESETGMSEEISREEIAALLARESEEQDEM